MAETKWWFCGDCGHKNHPRPRQDNSLCENCGHKQERDNVNDVDYDPGVINA